MRGRFRPPMFVIAAALVGLMALLATLQYKWLGRISDAERDSRRFTLNARTSAFASDFDREITLAYALFQLEPASDQDGNGDSLATRFGVRYDRWQAAARYPRLLKDFFIVSPGESGALPLQRFNPSTRFIEPAEWPAPLEALRAQLMSGYQEERTTALPEPRGGSRSEGTLVVRTMPTPLWEDVPALAVPMTPAPLALLNSVQGHPGVRVSPFVSYTVLVLDRDYMTREMLPALAAQHFNGITDGPVYQLAIVNAGGRGAIFQSTTGFDPKPDAKVDAAADLFQVRSQEYPQMLADVRRFTAIATPPGPHAIATFRMARGQEPSQGDSKATARDGRPRALFIEQSATVRDTTFVGSVASSTTRQNAPGRWRLMVKHPSGSLEAAVDSTRRRNLMISSSVLAVLAASMALLVLSTRRSQEVARQQMEFVAAVSHELRTPLAVIRSAGDNLADGVVGDPAQIRKYGELVRSEGRRLSEMVEQILEFAGIHSVQRRFEPRPVDVHSLLHDVLAASATLIDDAGITVQTDIPDALPPALGDEAALRRVFQNLVGNAIKYGGSGRWIGLAARASQNEIRIAIADRGIGIAPSEQARIFEPFYRAADVVDAQIQGAGLGLSLVQRTVDAHGGRVVVNSSPGAGSEFVVYLPTADARLVADAEPQPTEAPRYT